MAAELLGCLVVVVGVSVLVARGLFAWIDGDVRP